jgi:hypothetical protein
MYPPVLNIVALKVLTYDRVSRFQPLNNIRLDPVGRIAHIYEIIRLMGVTLYFAEPA